MTRLLLLASSVAVLAATPLTAQASVIDTQIPPPKPCYTVQLTLPTIGYNPYVDVCLPKP